MSTITFICIIYKHYLKVDNDDCDFEDLFPNPNMVLPDQFLKPTFKNMTNDDEDLFQTLPYPMVWQREAIYLYHVQHDFMISDDS